MKYTLFNYNRYEAHRIVYDLINEGSNVLDLGCATGYFARELNKKSCEVFGVDIEKDALSIAKKYCKFVLLTDFEYISEARIPSHKFDYVLLLDVLEHVKSRGELLNALHKYLKKDGTLLLSTPNIAHVSVRLSVLGGNFDYTNVGIMDSTHVHFYTRKTLLAELNNYGWEVTNLFASADFGQIPFISKIGKRVPKRIQWIITKLFPTLFGVQWIAVCKSRT